MAIDSTPYAFANLAPGGAPAAANLFDAVEYMANNQTLNDLIGLGVYRGTKLEDNGSIPATCNVWVTTDGLTHDVAEAGDMALIHYNNGGTHTFWATTCQVVGSDVFVAFGNADMYEPTPALSVIADYSNAAFIDGLTVWILRIGASFKIPYTMISLTATASGALTTTRLQHQDATGAWGVLRRFLNDLKTRVDAMLDGAGAPNANTVTANSLDDDNVLLTSNADNMLVCGSLQEPGVDENHLFGVIDGVTPPATSVFIERVITNGWWVAQGGISTGSNQDLLLSLTPHWRAQALRSRVVTLSVMVRSTVAASIDLGIYGTVGGYNTSTPSQTLLPNTWTLLSVSKTVDAAETGLWGVVRTNTACTFYFVEPTMTLGDVAYGHTGGGYYNAAKLAMNTQPDNLLFNGGFENWSNTAGDQPDGWHKVGAPTLAAGTTFFEGGFDCEMTCGQDQGIRQYLGVVTNLGAGGVPAVNEGRIINYLQGRYVTFSVYLTQSVGTDPVRISIHSHNGAAETETYRDVTPLATYNRYSISHLIQSDALYVWVEIVNREVGSAGQVYSIDAAMVNVGTIPLLYHESWGWRGTPYHFYSAGAVTVTNLNAQGVTAGRYPIFEGSVGPAKLILKGLVYALTPPAGGNNTFRALPDGVAGLTVVLQAAANYACNHVTDYEVTPPICNTYLAADVSAIGGGANEAADVIFTLWGYEYNPV